MMGIPFSTPEENDPDQYLNKAKRLTKIEILKHHPWASVRDYTRDFEVYIVKFTKTLQNWKAALSTSIADGRYYELTYNGDKKETYIDTYEKVSNRVVKDED